MRVSNKKSFERSELERGIKSYARDELEKYCEAHSTSPSALCVEIDNYTQQNFELARMIIGSWQASFLQFLVMTTKAKRVLEIGTFTGYSALAMAEALPADGELITVDVNVETTQLARSFWDKSAAGKKIKTVTKPALEALEELAGEFDRSTSLPCMVLQLLANNTTMLLNAAHRIKLLITPYLRLKKTT